MDEAMEVICFVAGGREIAVEAWQVLGVADQGLPVVTPIKSEDLLGLPPAPPSRRHLLAVGNCGIWVEVSGPVANHRVSASAVIPSSAADMLGPVPVQAWLDLGGQLIPLIDLKAIVPLGI